MTFRFKLQPEHLTRNCSFSAFAKPNVPIQLKRIIRLYCLLRARDEIIAEYGYDRSKLNLIVHLSRSCWTVLLKEFNGISEICTVFMRQSEIDIQEG